jgi:hypothetical protein
MCDFRNFSLKTKTPPQYFSTFVLYTKGVFCSYLIDYQRFTSASRRLKRIFRKVSQTPYERLVERSTEEIFHISLNTPATILGYTTTFYYFIIR